MYHQDNNRKLVKNSTKKAFNKLLKKSIFYYKRRLGEIAKIN